MTKTPPTSQSPPQPTPDPGAETACHIHIGVGPTQAFLDALKAGWKLVAFIPPRKN